MIMVTEKTKPATAQTSLLDRLKKLDDERSKLIEGAKSEAMTKAKEAIDELNSLGFHYRLTDMAQPARVKSPGASTRQMKNEPCPICHFLTNPPHDRRAHRMQKTKAPFSAAELKEKGYEKTEPSKAA